MRPIVIGRMKNLLFFNGSAIGPRERTGSPTLSPIPTPPPSYPPHPQYACKLQSPSQYTRIRPLNIPHH